MEKDLPGTTPTDLQLTRQRKTMTGQIAKRSQQLVGGKIPAHWRGQYYNGNKDLGHILDLQNQAHVVLTTVKDAKDHFERFLWEPQYMTTYTSMIEKYLSDPTGATSHALSAKKPVGQPKGSKNKTTAAPSDNPPVAPMLPTLPSPPALNTANTTATTSLANKPKPVNTRSRLNPTINRQLATITNDPKPVDIRVNIGPMVNRPVITKVNDSKMAANSITYDPVDNKSDLAYKVVEATDTPVQPAMICVKPNNTVSVVIPAKTNDRVIYGTKGVGTRVPVTGYEEVMPEDSAGHNRTLRDLMFYLTDRDQKPYFLPKLLSALFSEDIILEQHTYAATQTGICKTESEDEPCRKKIKVNKKGKAVKYE